MFARGKFVVKGNIKRNSLCPCDSGRKYKKCHLQSQVTSNIKEIHRKLEQGLGKPIVSQNHGQTKTIYVGAKAITGKWKTFHDFLFQYIADIFGYSASDKKFNDLQGNDHPLEIIFKRITEQLSTSQNHLSDGIFSGEMTGAMRIYMSLSYNLYLISHNSVIQEKLISDLKNANQFLGALYETFIAAIFIKAGFILEFENERDRSTSHCEFIATCKRTGKKYSVEAKSKNWKSEINPSGQSKLKIDFRPSLSKALKKTTCNERIIFIELNLPSDMISATDKCGETLVSMLRKHEEVNLGEIITSPAYVFLTNHPYGHALDKLNEVPLYLPDGFKIDNFGRKQMSLEERIKSEHAHQPVYELMKSIKKHQIIPATFDGELPENSYINRRSGFSIGEAYVIDDKVCELILGTVKIPDKTAYLTYKDEEGKLIIKTQLLNNYELNAYVKSPNTFFGKELEQGMHSETLHDFYSFLYKSFRKKTKSWLLGKLKNLPNYDFIQNQTQDYLLRLYCQLLSEGNWHGENTGM